MSQPNDFRFDKRIIEKNLRTGVVTQQEYEAYLKKLKDLSGEANVMGAVLSPIEKELPTGVIEEDEEL